MLPSLRRVSRSCAWSLAACATIIGPGPAQEKPGVAIEPEEATVLQLGTKELGAYAGLAWKNGFPKLARLTWQEVLGEYAPDDEVARKALGFYRHGEVWQLDPKFVFPDQDKPDVAVARMLEQKWTGIAQRLGDAHRVLSGQLAAANKTARSEYHAQRALRFLPKDAKVVAAAGQKQFEGITGTELDLGILRRSRLMDRAVTTLTEQQFPAATPADKHPVLDKGGMPYTGFRSETFVVYGDWEPDVLQQAAAWAERALLFCREAYAGCEGFPPGGQPVTKMAFFKQKDTWSELVKMHADQIGRDRVDFVVQNASSTRIGDMHTSGAEDMQVVFDLAVRWVAQDFAGLGSDAMREGIGHAVVAMFFGRNLVFSVGQQEQEGTVSGSRDQAKLQLPDLETWRELAVEIAWAKGGTTAARLPLLKAAQFPSDARIKAWSFCDYLLRRDPLLLRHLDRTVAKARTENDVEAQFAEFAKEPLAEVEAGWRRFWTEDSALKRAVLAKSTPLESASKEAPAWLEQFNRVRQQHGSDPVGWSAQLSIDCKQHVDYLRANKDQRGPDKEHAQLPGKPGFANSGRTFAQTAVVWTRDKDAKKAADLWMLLPGYRDALLDKNVDTVGIYAEGGIMVLDPARGRAAKAQVTTAVWPVANLKGGRARDPVPGAVDVELLGPEVQRLLAKNQRGKKKQIGYPLTAHFFGTTAKDLTCVVTCQGEPVPGFLVEAKGTIRRTSAPGLWVFYPAEPLRKGVDVKVVWKWTGGGHEVTFVSQ